MGAGRPAEVKQFQVPAKPEPRFVNCCCQFLVLSACMIVLHVVASHSDSGLLAVFHQNHVWQRLVSTTCYWYSNVGPKIKCSTFTNAFRAWPAVWLLKLVCRFVFFSVQDEKGGGAGRDISSSHLISMVCCWSGRCHVSIFTFWLKSFFRAFHVQFLRCYLRSCKYCSYF